MLHLVTKTLGQRAGALARAGRCCARQTCTRQCHTRRTLRRGLAAAALLALCAAPALAQEPPPSAEDLARAVIEEAGGAGQEIADVRALVDAAHAGSGESAGSGEIADWTGSAVADALRRAGSAASETVAGAADGMGETPAPLPAENHAGRAVENFAARQGTAEVLVFMSLAVPEASWAQWAAQTARTGAPLVLRGVSTGGLRATATEIGRRLGGHESGVAVDPRLFRLFGVERVPAVIAVPGGVPACASRGCADDAPPPFDAVAGNIGLAAALEAIAAEGAVARETAIAHLERLGRRP
ncbi:MAG: type-F conjugative transfer system pilin assembly protein TrbC [Gammaproteobacteria bacterium]|nr:type-F conjugative transfer system pilin assembly protein TrbC [Gammaproteobacteria bacterium]MYI24546.1 type-F conjugative transfer system pilin assembly protein TrbC [Gammaproteobacteria bacterium]